MQGFALSLLLVSIFSIGQKPGEKTDSTAKAVTVVKKAVEAHGGEERLKRLGAGTFKFKGTAVVDGDEFPCTGSVAYHFPGKQRQETRLQLDQGELLHLVVFDGDKIFVSLDGRQIELDEAARREQRATAVFQELVMVAPLLDQSRFSIALGKDVDVNGKPASAVVVVGKGLRDAILYFDKATGYLVKTSRKIPGPDGGEVLEEANYFDFAKADGVVYGKKTVFTLDGKPHFTAVVSDYRMLEKLDAKAFDVPAKERDQRPKDRLSNRSQGS